MKRTTLATQAARIAELEAQLAASKPAATPADVPAQFKHYPGLGLAKRVSGPTGHPVVKGALMTREGQELFVQGYYDADAWSFTLKEFGTWKAVAEVKATAVGETEFVGNVTLGGKEYALRCRYGVTSTNGSNALKLKLEAPGFGKSIALKNGFPVGKVA